ncbi:MAG: hypothetical protein ACP5RE_02120 [Candidatus Acidifodinimicrobium sp.]
MIGEAISREKKFLVLFLILLYFVVGFTLIIVSLSKYIGGGDAGLVGILYLAAGWFFLYKRNGLFKIMRIKYK